MSSKTVLMQPLSCLPLFIREFIDLVYRVDSWVTVPNGSWSFIDEFGSWTNASVFDLGPIGLELITFYFGYGSNLNGVELRAWCRKKGEEWPLGCQVGRGRLPDVDLCFNRTLTLCPRIGQLVEGQLFEITPKGWDVLDRKEGVATGCHERVPVHVCRETGEMAAAFAYIDFRRIRNCFVQPRVASVDVIHGGRRTYGLETGTLEAAAANETVPLAVNSLFVYGTLLRGE